MSKAAKAAAVALILSSPLGAATLSWADAPGAVAAPAAVGQDVGTVAFYDEVPCASEPGHPRAHKARRAHRRPVARAAARAKPHRLRAHKIAHHAPRHRPGPVKRVAVVHPQRCTVLHRDRLTKADFVLDPIDSGSSLEPTQPYGYSSADAPRREYFASRSAPARDFGPNFGSGGGGALSSGSSPSPVAAAPEPQTWLLMMLGVGFAGVALRRRRDEEGRMAAAL